jgi:hypothetical protein
LVGQKSAAGVQSLEHVEHAGIVVIWVKLLDDKRSQYAIVQFALVRCAKFLELFPFVSTFGAESRKTENLTLPVFLLAEISLKMVEDAAQSMV